MNKIKRWYETVKSLVLYPKIIKELKSSKSTIFFIFPCYETGGGERVHADIMASVTDLHPTCLITHISRNDDMKEAFESFANLINLERWGWKRSFKKKMIQKVAEVINNKPEAIVFGCNSHFFYDLLPYLSESITKIDLMHTYLGDQDFQWSFERYSLPVVEHLTKRVVLGEGHKSKLASFYQQHQVNSPPETVVIHNKVNTPDTEVSKPISAELNILFVARNTFEKRPYLFLEIARQSLQKKLPLRFIMIGDFENFIKEAPKNVTITGRITSTTELNNFYNNAHVILITSIFEGFPLVLLEGMSRGVIPISTDVGEVATFVNEETKTGFIISNDNDDNYLVDKFVGRLIHIIKNPEEASIVSLNVQKLVRRNFSESVFVQKYRDLLTSSVKNNV